MTDSEFVDALRDLGIEVPDQTVEETRNTVANMLKEAAKFGMPVEDGLSRFALWLLVRLGRGAYDYGTGDWTPTSAQVYAFDGEVFDIDRMYTHFLQGVAAIVPGFACSDVSETTLDEDLSALFEEGSDDPMMALMASMVDGVTKVSLNLNGHHYERELARLGDWFNPDAIEWVNELLAEEGFAGRLHCYSDGEQGLIMLYGDKAYGERLDSIIPKRV